MRQHSRNAGGTDHETDSGEVSVKRSSIARNRDMTMGPWGGRRETDLTNTHYGRLCS